MQRKRKENSSDALSFQLCLSDDGHCKSIMIKLQAQTRLANQMARTPQVGSVDDGTMTAYRCEPLQAPPVTADLLCTDSSSIQRIKRQARYVSR
jgi:hypothetical protein